MSDINKEIERLAQKYTEEHPIDSNTDYPTLELKNAYIAGYKRCLNDVEAMRLLAKELQKVIDSNK